MSLSLISLFSCADFLDRDPKGVMDQDRFFLSPDAGYSAVVKCYKTLNDVAGYEAPRMDLYNISTDDSEKEGLMQVIALLRETLVSVELWLPILIWLTFGRICTMG